MKHRGHVMLPGEVARMFGVDTKTVQRWSANGKLPHFFTLGGHRRYRKDEMDQIMARLSFVGPAVAGDYSTGE